MSDQLKKPYRGVCPICKKVFTCKSGLSRHLKTTHTTYKRKMHQCNICNRSFLKLSVLNMHRQFHSKNATNVERKEKEKISEMYKNVVSETLYSSDSDCEYELLQTVIKVTSERNCTYPCEYCDKNFMSKINLNRHVFNKHTNTSFDVEMQSSNTDDMQIGSDLVGSSTAADNMQIDDTDNQEIITIQTITSDSFDRKFRCHLCKRSYSQKIYLENHMRLHESGKLYADFEDPLEEKYLCTLCGKHFSSSSHLSVHMKLHVDGKKYLCSYCGKCFALQRYLALHQKTHMKEKAFVCEYCNKRFIHKGALVEHLRIHAGIKPHECTLCDKKFTHYSGLTQHLRTHTDEKKYNCDVCGKNFRFGGHYRGHMRTHTGDKPFVCTICGKKFTLRGSLAIHYRIHTGERPYKCEICDKGFVKSYNLKVHLKTHNPRKRKVDGRKVDGEKK